MMSAAALFTFQMILSLHLRNPLQPPFQWLFLIAHGRIPQCVLFIAPSALLQDPIPLLSGFAGLCILIPARNGIGGLIEGSNQVFDLQKTSPQSWPHSQRPYR